MSHLRKHLRLVASGVAVLGCCALAACSHGSKDTASSVTPSGGAVTSTSASSTAGSSAPSSKPATSSGRTTTHASSTHPRSSSVSPSVVPSAAVTTKPAVPFSSAASFGGGVSVKVTKIADQTSSDTGPGTIKGEPAVAFTLSFRNDSGAAISVNTVNVTATYGSSDTPASSANSSSNAPFAGTVKPGGTATGVYAFAIPKNARGDVTLQLWYAQGKPVVVISGTVS